MKITFTLNDELTKKLDKIATNNKRSRSNMIATIIQEYIENESNNKNIKK